VELLNQAWNKPKLKYRSPNVLRLIGRSTAISMWVASCILWQPTLKERTRVLTKLINIADVRSSSKDSSQLLMK
jgi:glycine hydroxymethyltransferase/Rap guanine nucleotide exchange factor 1